MLPPNDVRRKAGPRRTTRPPESIEPPAVGGAKSGNGGDANSPNDGDKIARLGRHQLHHREHEAIATFSRAASPARCAIIASIQ